MYNLSEVKMLIYKHGYVYFFDIILSIWTLSWKTDSLFLNQYFFFSKITPFVVVVVVVVVVV